MSSRRDYIIIGFILSNNQFLLQTQIKVDPCKAHLSARINLYILKVKPKRYLIFIPAIVGAFLLGLSFTSFNKSATKTSPTPQVISAKTQASQSAVGTQSTTVKVARVIDGDTIEIEGGQKVRLI